MPGVQTWREAGELIETLWNVNVRSGWDYELSFPN